MIKRRFANPYGQATWTGHEREGERVPHSRLSRRPQWLIARHAISRLEVLTIGSGDDEALPVFSFEEEAQMFLRLQAGTLAGRWKVRRTSPGELASMLYGPCREVRRVTLDPLPEACSGALNGLLSVRREEFVLALLGDASSTPRLPAALAHRSTGLVSV